MLDTRGKFLGRGRQALAVFPGDDVHRVPEEMDDAGLCYGFGIGGGDRLGKALQAIDDGQKVILCAAAPEPAHHPDC